jgi:phage terminase small subunit
MESVTGVNPQNTGITRPRMPAKLKASGKSLWREMTATYQFSPSELATLRQACFTVDLIDDINAELAKDGLTVIGSTGQLRANPLIAAISDNRRTLEILFRDLALPVPGESAGIRRSPGAKSAAVARIGLPNTKRGLNRG